MVADHADKALEDPSPGQLADAVLEELAAEDPKAAQIEAVAKVIHREVDAGMGRLLHLDPDGWEWDQLKPEVKAVYRTVAREAIKAARDA